MAEIDIKGRFVLVTGASSGIGRAITEFLSSHQVKVLACARREADISALSTIPNVAGHRMDVTDNADIEAVANSLLLDETRLYAIINNAGIAVGGPMLTLPESELVDCLRVNAIGPVNVIRHLFPLLEDDGCIINMSSMGARYVSPWMAPYHMSKTALEAYTDSLRMELSPFGIRVVIVEPGAVRTEAFGKWDRLLGQMRGTVYEEAFDRYWQMITQQHAHALSPIRIAQLIWRVLCDPRPRSRYLIPHRPAVRAMILLARLGLSDLIYRHFLRHVRRVHPSHFLSGR